MEAGEAWELGREVPDPGRGRLDEQRRSPGARAWPGVSVSGSGFTRRLRSDADYRRPLFSSLAAERELAHRGIQRIAPDRPWRSRRALVERRARVKLRNNDTRHSIRAAQNAPE